MRRLQRIIRRTLSALLCLLCLASCGKAEREQNKKINVVTTVFPLYDFARAVGGERAEINMLIKAGCEVHSYDPKPSDIISVERSDLFLYVGGESDEWVESLLSDTKVSSYALIDCVDTLLEDGEDEADEHIWTSDENAVIMVEKICELFCKADKQNSGYYRKNTKEYVEKIRSASKEIKRAAENLDARFILVADRFPFKYFASQYNLDYVAAFGGCASGNDISIKTMRKLVDTVNERNLKWVFCTEMSSGVIANALSEQTGVGVLELHSAHNVTLDDFKNGVTYVDIMLRNAKTLNKAGGAE